MRSSLASITKTHSDEFAVRCLMRSRALFIIAGFFLATAACAQSLPDESGSLATALSDRAASIAPTAKLRPRLSATARTAPAPKSSAAVDSGKNRRKPLEKLGVNKHRFVHCGLANGKVRTEIRGNGYMLKDGMLISQWIRFTDLQAAPRPVPAAGTRTAFARLQTTAPSLACRRLAAHLAVYSGIQDRLLMHRIKRCGGMP